LLCLLSAETFSARLCFSVQRGGTESSTACCRIAGLTQKPTKHEREPSSKQNTSHQCDASQSCTNLAMKTSRLTALLSTSVTTLSLSPHTLLQRKGTKLKGQSKSSTLGVHTGGTTRDQKSLPRAPRHSTKVL
jgi:hypothetical protein